MKLDQNIQNEPYNEFKDSPLYAFFASFGKKKANKDKPAVKAEPLGAPNPEDFEGFLRVDKVVKKIMRFFCWLSAIALIVVMMVAFINVIGEKLVRAGVSWASGINNSTAIIQYFHIPLVFLAAGYVTLDQGHTRIDLLIQKFPKVEKFFMLIGHILGAAISFFISYRGIAVTLVENFKVHAHISTTADSWQVWPFTICHCLGFFLLGISFIWAFVRMVKFWKYPGVNPGVYLYPNEHHGPGAPQEAFDEEEGGADK